MFEMSKRHVSERFQVSIVYQIWSSDGKPRKHLDILKFWAYMWSTDFWGSTLRWARIKPRGTPSFQDKVWCKRAQSKAVKKSQWCGGESGESGVVTEKRILSAEGSGWLAWVLLAEKSVGKVDILTGLTSHSLHHLTILKYFLHWLLIIFVFLYSISWAVFVLCAMIMRQDDAQRVTEVLYLNME